VFYSSGSVGVGKAVPLTDAQILFAARAYPDDAIRPSDRIALGVPASHIFGFVRGVLHGLLSDAELIVFSPGRDPVGDAEAAGGTIAMLSSRQILLATRIRRACSLRAVLTGGAPVPESAARVIEQQRGVPLRAGYGLTETAGLATRQRFGRPRRPGTAGPTAPGMRVDVVGSDGEPARPGQEGEIRITGPSVFDGYADPREPSPFDAEGRFRTGDLGLFDEEGELIVRGRAGLTIRSQGRVLCAEEVETAALEDPGILDAAAVPLGEAFGLLVVSAEDSGSVAARLRRRMANRLPRFGRPRRVRFVASIPRRPTGKIDREAVSRFFDPD
jgi:acyl-coenzyme A synthetase/AMP-(fatty) acid ligase